MTSRNVSRGVLTAGAVVALAGAYGLGHRDADASPVIKTANVITPAEFAARVGTPEFSDIVATYGPAVVNISAKHVASSGDSEDADGNKPSMESLGSGFIISQSGDILTNNHVVDGADVVTVKLKDRREFRAKVIGTDKQSDVAVLKIDPGDLPTVRIGDPAKSKVGERVLAIGSPYGLDNTVTSGIISAKSRTLPGEGYTPFIQTDVPVNPGNSGGPLFNGKGEVIGINSMIYSRTGGFQGLSFAIPIDEAIKVKNDLVKNGYVTRGRLGVAVGPVDQSAAQSLGMKKPQGALVASVDPDGPAATAGIQAGDVILSVNGTRVSDTGDLPAQIAGMSPGTTADIGIWRDAGERSLSVRLGVQPSVTEQAGVAERPAHVRLGVAVRPLSPQEQSDAFLSSGLLVEQAQNAAANAGIEPGDVILAVDGEPVENVDQLRKMISQAGDSVSLQIQRNGEQMSVPVKLG